MVFFITGISKGFGLELTEYYLIKGYKVFGISKSNLMFNELLNKSLNFGNFYFERVDINSHFEIEKAVNKCIEKFGRIDVLINNAAIKIFIEPEELTFELLKNTINTNFISQIFITQLVLKQMIKQKSGQIINIASRAGMEFYSSGIAYCLSKSALINFTEIMAEHLKKYNIKINVISPPTFSTEDYKKSRPDLDHSKFLQSKKIIQKIDEILSDNNFITGQNFPFFSLKSFVKYSIIKIYELLKFLIYDVRRI